MTSVLSTALIFIILDIIFVQMEIWVFNPLKLFGIYFLNIPIEEYLFFLTLPYASLFVYDYYRLKTKRDILQPFSRFISGILVLILLVASILFSDKLYSIVIFIFLGISLYFLQYVLRVNFLGRFYFTFLLILIPFLVIHSLLTGGMSDEQIIWFNKAEIIGIKIHTIPLEHVFYGMLMILLNISFYEGFKSLIIKKKKEITYSRRSTFDSLGK